MNPLQEIHDIIERLLFRIGDEQLPVPDQVLLVMVSGEQATRYLIQNGATDTTILTTIITAVAGEAEDDES